MRLLILLVCTLGVAVSAQTPQKIVKDGIEIEFTAEAPTSKSGLTAGEDAVFRFKIRDTTSKTPLSGARPCAPGCASWTSALRPEPRRPSSRPRHQAREPSRNASYGFLLPFSYARTRPPRARRGRTRGGRRCSRSSRPDGSAPLRPTSAHATWIVAATPWSRQGACRGGRISNIPRRRNPRLNIRFGHRRTTDAESAYRPTPRPQHPDGRCRRPRPSVHFRPR